jgi:hypothetical protein
MGKSIRTAPGKRGAVAILRTCAPSELCATFAGRNISFRGGKMIRAFGIATQIALISATTWVAGQSPEALPTALSGH